MHWHVVPPAFIDALRRDGLGGTAHIERDPDGIERLSLHLPEGSSLERGSRFVPSICDDRHIIAGLDRLKLDAAAISVSPSLFYHWADPAVGAGVARIINDGLAELVRAHPARLIGLASLPMQDGLLAAEELQRAVTQLGFRGAEICTSLEGVDLDDARFSPLFAKAEELEVPLFLHPQNAGDTRRLKNFHLSNLVGFPTETATAATHLIFGGVFERFPGLKVVLAHGGGYLPYQVGRLDHGYEVRGEAKVNIPRPPSAYLSNLYFDSLTHMDLACRYLIDLVGADHVVIGTDFPFDMACMTPVDAIKRLGLGPERESKVLGGTAQKLLKLS